MKEAVAVATRAYALFVGFFALLSKTPSFRTLSSTTF